MQRDIPNVVTTFIQAQYQAKIELLKPLQSGDNGSVSMFELEKDGKLFQICVKSIPVSNGSAMSDVRLSQLAYNSDSFKCWHIIHDGFIYLTTPFFKGKPLSSFIEKELATKNFDTRLKIILNVDRSVKAIHKKGIIHRDLKADNFMIDDQYKVNVIDFGRGVSVDEVRHLQHLSLYSTKPVSHAFMPLVQLFRKGQKQTAPELKASFSHFKNYEQEQYVGFRSDYYALANLMVELAPELTKQVEPIIKAEEVERGVGYIELIEKLKVLSYLLTERPDANATLTQIFALAKNIEATLSHEDKKVLDDYIETGERKEAFAKIIQGFEALAVLKNRFMQDRAWNYSLSEKIKVLSYLLNKELDINLESQADLTKAFGFADKIEKALSAEERKALSEFIAAGEKEDELAEIILRLQLMSFLKARQIDLAKSDVDSLQAAMTEEECRAVKLYLYTNIEYPELLDVERAAKELLARTQLKFDLDNLKISTNSSGTGSGINLDLDEKPLDRDHRLKP